MRFTLRYLGVPIKPKSYMFDNNRSVVTNATLPHSTLSKRFNILTFHRVREAIAAEIIDFHWIQPEYNLGDMLSKHWENIKIIPMIQKLFITCGPITQIPRTATEEISKLTKQYIHTHKTSKHHKLDQSHKQSNIQLFIQGTQQYIFLHFYLHIITRKTCHIYHRRGVTEV